MIVPRNQLILAALLLGVPLGTLVGIDASAVGAMVVLVLLVIAVLVDLLWSYGCLDDISVQVPPVSRLSRQQEGTIELELQAAEKVWPKLDVGLPLPESISSEWSVQQTSLTEAGKHWRMAWPCTPQDRGKYAINAVFLACASKLGFWELRKRVPLEAEIRVYPNLHVERQQTAAFFLPNRGIGIQLQRMVGKGREFEKLREYMPGDCFEDVHWKATAKRGFPVTKTYQMERTQEVYVIVDHSRLSARRQVVEQGGTSEEEQVLERFVSAALMLGLAAERQGDSFGLLTFDNKVGRFIKAGRGKAHFDACRDALYTVTPSAGNPDFENLCTFIRNRIRKRALLVVLTSLDDPVLAESLERSIQLISRQHLVVVNMMTPSGAGPLFDDRPLASEDEIYQRLAGHEIWYRLAELKKVFSRYGVRMEQLEQSAMSLTLLNQYMTIKQKQIL